MSTVTGSIDAAVAHFGISLLHMRALIDLVDIPRFRAWREGRRIRMAWDSDLKSAEDLWHALDEAGWTIENAADLARYRRIRSILVDPYTYHPEAVVLGELRVNGPHPTTRRICRQLNGRHRAVNQALEVAARHEGRAMPTRPRAQAAVPIDAGRFVGEHAPVLAGLPSTKLDPDFGNVHPAPDERWLGRAALMTHPDTVAMTGLFTLVWPGRLSVSSAKGSMTLLERLDQVADGSPLTDPAVLEAAMRQLVVEGAGDTDDTRIRFVRTYGWTRNKLLRWLDELPEERRASYRRFVPGPLPPEVAGWEPRRARRDGGDDARGDQHVDGGDDDGVGDNRDHEARDDDVPTPTARELTAEEVTLRRKEIASAIEHLWAVLLVTDRKVEAKLATIRERLAAGLPVDFPVGVPVTHPVVRPDGMLGIGDQTTFLEIDTAARLWRECARRSGDREHRARLSREERAPLTRERERAEVGDGQFYDPASATDLKILYRHTAPVKPGGEHHEPFWVPILRSGVLLPGARPTVEAAARAAGMLALLGVGDLHKCAGLLVPDDREAINLMAACLDTLDLVVWPHAEFTHGMSIARYCVSAELVCGVRIGESTQASDSPGRITWRKRDGKMLFFVHSVPKDGDVLKARQTDKVTMGALRDVRGRLARRFSLGVAGPLPHVPYQVPERKACEPSGYIIRNATRTVKTIEANLLIAVLTCGIVQSTSHPYKYGFAAMMTEAGATPLMLNAACEHAPNSPMSAGYARFAEAAAVERLIGTAQDDMAADLMLWGLME